MRVEIKESTLWFVKEGEKSTRLGENIMLKCVRLENGSTLVKPLVIETQTQITSNYLDLSENPVRILNQKLKFGAYFWQHIFNNTG